MRIVSTKVVTREDGSGRPVVSVTFDGEGGDCITIDMEGAPDVGMTEQGAVERARAIMVQVASFDQQASTDSVGVSGSSDNDNRVLMDQNKYIYVIEYRDAGKVEVMPPVNLPSDQVAREEAVRSAIDLLQSADNSDATGWAVRVMKSDATLVSEVTFEQARLMANERRR